MKKANEMTLREKVMAIIEDKSLTDYRVAKETKISLSTVQDLRSGKKDPGKMRLESAETYERLYHKLYDE